MPKLLRVLAIAVGAILGAFVIAVLVLSVVGGRLRKRARRSASSVAGTCSSIDFFSTSIEIVSPLQSVKAQYGSCINGIIPTS